MTSKERVNAVFQHQKPDRVPMWCGASPEFMQKARTYLGVSTDEEVLLRFHDDFRRVYSRYAGPKEFDSLENAALGKTVSVFGVERHGIGYGQPISHPLQNATLEEIHQYSWPDPDWIDISNVRADAMKYQGEYAILGGEWCPFFHDAIDLLGMEHMLILMYEEPELVHAVLSHIVDYYYEVSKRIFESASDVMDIFFIGNDFGTQTGPIMGPDLFEEFMCPHLTRLADLGHSYNLHVMMHCCGSFEQLIPSIIACKVDALQSLQPTTETMQPAYLKTKYLNQIVINGCIDSIEVLIEGTEDQTRNVTREILEIMKPNGGYILSASHDYLLEETPVENVIAMFDTGIQYGSY